MLIIVIGLMIRLIIGFLGGTALWIALFVGLHFAFSFLGFGTNAMFGFHLPPKNVVLFANDALIILLLFISTVMIFIPSENKDRMYNNLGKDIISAHKNFFSSFGLFISLLPLFFGISAHYEESEILGDISRIEGYLFGLDQLLRGMLMDIFELFKIQIANVDYNISLNLFDASVFDSGILIAGRILVGPTIIAYLFFSTSRITKDQSEKKGRQEVSQ